MYTVALQDMGREYPYLGISWISRSLWDFFIFKFLKSLSKMFSSPRLVKGLVETELVQPVYNLIYMAARVGVRAAVASSSSPACHQPASQTVRPSCPDDAQRSASTYVRSVVVRRYVEIRKEQQQIPTPAEAENLSRRASCAFRAYR